MTPRVVLVGLPGAGKSTSGRRLARILGIDFVDSDDLVQAAEGRTVARIFADSGEAAFRDAECLAISDCLDGPFDGVLALGGGALLQETTRAALVASGITIAVLHAPLRTLVARVGDGRTRPLLSGDPAGRLAALAELRQPIYDSVATLSVETGHRSPGQVAAHIAARLHEMGALA